MATKYKDGTMYRKRVRCADGKYHDVYARTLSELDRKTRALVAELGQYVAELSEAERKVSRDMYVYEYCQKFYKIKAPTLSLPRQKTLAFDINNIICPAIGGKKLSEIRLDDLKLIITGLADKSKSYNKRVVQTLKQIFSAAYDAGIIDRDPSLRLRSGGKPAKQVHALTEQQQAALLDAVRGERIETFVYLALFAGLRREEICGLKWDAVELDAPTPYLTVRRACRWPTNSRPEVSELLKSDAAYRTIPLPKILTDRLRARRSDFPASPWVVSTAEGEMMTYSALQSQWHAVELRTASDTRPLGTTIKNHKITVTLDFAVTPHMLRHTYITRLILGGADLRRTQYLAGHADPQVTLKIYTDLIGHTPADLAPTVNAVFSPENNL